MGSPEPDRMLTAGARSLRDYIDRLGISVPAFCEKHGLDRITVQNILNGERKRISVDFAELIERATDGAVGWRLWLSKTRRPGVALSQRRRKSPARTTAGAS